MTLQGVEKSTRNPLEPSASLDQVLYVTNSWFRSLKPHTLRSYKRWIFRFLLFFDNSTDRILVLRPADIRTFLTSLVDEHNTPLNPSSKNNALAAIKSWYRELCLNSVITANPAINIKGFRCSPIHTKALEKEEIQQGLQNISFSKQNSINARNKATVSLLIHHALRRSEICSLMVSDFDGSNLLIHGKGGTETRIMLSKNSITAINDWLIYRNSKKSDSDNLFINGWDGTSITPQAIANMVKKVFNCSPHQLRATSTTMVYEQSNNIRIAQSHARHANINTTLIYTQNSRQKELHQYLPDFQD